jgi:hypothetical protein
MGDRPTPYPAPPGDVESEPPVSLCAWSELVAACQASRRVRTGYTELVKWG